LIDVDMQVVQKFVCGDASCCPASDADDMSDNSEADVDSVETVGFSTRCHNTVLF